MSRRQTAPALAQLIFYGGLKPQGAINEDGFKGHAAEQTWDDGGIARDLIEQDMAALREEIAGVVTRFAETLAQEQASYGAYQARDAVAEYVSNSFLDVALIDGHACLVLDCSNNAAQFRVWWRLADVIDAAQRGAQTAGDRQMLSAIDQALGMQVGAVSQMPGDRIKAEIATRAANQAAVPLPGAIGTRRQMSRRTP